MIKTCNTMLVAVMLFLSSCSINPSEANAINDDMFIKPVALAEDENINLPPDGFIPFIYDYVANENIKTMKIEVVDYTDANNPYVVNSYGFKLNKETLKGRIYIKYFMDNNDLNIEIKAGKQINKISSILEIYDRTHGWAITYNTESIIKKGKQIPIYNILYADSFSYDVREFSKNPKHPKDNYSSAYQITITFFDKYIDG